MSAIKAIDIVKWDKISVVLTGNPNTIRADRPNKKHAEKIASLLEFVQNWIDGKGEVKISVKVKEDQSTYDGFAPKYEIKDEAPDIPAEILKKMWNEANPKKLDYVSVAALPNDRKIMTEEGYRGLYSSGKKFYTNKVLEGKLDIREWSDLSKAKKYLDNLK